MTLPLRLPGARMTAIIDMKVDELLTNFMDRVDAVIPDGVFPGTQDLPPNQRLNNYLMNTTAVSDLSLLAIPNYTDLYKAGQVPAPQSPFWLNALSMPDEFEKLRADFESLAKRTQR